VNPAFSRAATIRLGPIRLSSRSAAGKFHIAGPPNGGIAAFHVAAANPQYFLSVTAFAGYMWQPTAAKRQAISKLCAFMYVGENDEYMWHDEMKREAELTLLASPWATSSPSRMTSAKPGTFAGHRRNNTM
jgi:S-formylglutathione hydrolase FrmB